MDTVKKRGEIISADQRLLVSQRYKRITRAVNSEFWNSDSETTHSLYVGSYGRGTAIDTSDIDMLVESVYRDRLDRQQFHRQFITFGVCLYFLVALIQYLLGVESYIELIELWYVNILLHGVIFINSYFLINGERYYNEDVGAE